MATRMGCCLLLLAIAAGCSSSNSTENSSSRAFNGGGKTSSSSTGGATTSGTGGSSSSFGEAPAPSKSSPEVTDAGLADACVGTRCYSQTTDTADCGYQNVEAKLKTIEKPGNLLFVYDRSGSMNDDWNGQPKYMAAGNAIIAAINPVQNLLLQVGSEFFPGAAPLPICNDGTTVCNILDPVDILGCCLMQPDGCFVPPITAADEINFTTPADFISRLPGQWQAPQGMRYSTPLEAGIREANIALTNTMFDGSVSIVIVTDGEPNCNTNQQNVLDQVTAWNAAGYKTYVVGLPGAQGAAAFLDQLAVAGGSGQYIDPADPATLQQKISDIVFETVNGGITSCDIDLSPPAEAPDKLRLVVKTEDGTESGVDRMLSDDSGWTVTDDGSMVTLEGLLCDNALAGTYVNLRFDFGCLDLPPLPPPDPPVLK